MRPWRRGGELSGTLSSLSMHINPRICSLGCFAVCSARDFVRRIIMGVQVPRTIFTRELFDWKTLSTKTMQDVKRNKDIENFLDREGHDSSLPLPERLKRMLQPRQHHGSSLLRRSDSAGSNRTSKTMRSRKSGVDGSKQFGSSSSTAAQRDLQFITSRHMLETRAIVHVDPTKLDVWFRFDPKYIGPGGKGNRRADGERKYSEAREALKGNRRVFLPAACLQSKMNRTKNASAYGMKNTLSGSEGLDGGEAFVHISDGSALFSVLRDLRIPVIPILVPLEEQHEFEARFGIVDQKVKKPEVTIRMQGFTDEDLQPWRANEHYKQAMETTVAKINTLHNITLKSMGNEDSLASAMKTSTAAAATPSEKTEKSSSKSKDLMPNQKEIDRMMDALQFEVVESSLKGRQIVYLDVQRLNSAFYYDHKYVGPGGEGSRRERSLTEYAAIRKALKQKCSAPILAAQLLDPSAADATVDRRTIDLVDNVVHFVQGSHMFAILRDAGCPVVPVLVMEDEVDDFQLCFGYEESALQSLMQLTERRAQATAEVHMPKWLFPKISVIRDDDERHPWRRKWPTGKVGKTKTAGLYH